MNKQLLAGSIVAVALTLGVGVAHAQDDPPAPPPGGQGGGPGGFGGPGGRGGFGGPGMGGMRARQASLANAPIEALTAGLKLTTDQTQKIKDIQAKVRPQGGPGGFGRRGGFGGPGGQGGPGGPGGAPGADPAGAPGAAPAGAGGAPGDQGGPGGPGGGGQGGRQDFQAMMQKMQQAEADANKQIEAVLTDEQKPLVPGVLKDIQTMQAANLPAELLGTLNLTADQKTKLAAVSAKSQKSMQDKMQAARDSGDFSSMRQAMTDSRMYLDKDVAGVLTTEQNDAVKAYKKAHPPMMGGRGGFGGPGGGFGGPGGGGPGGPGGGGPGGGGPGGPPPER